MHRTPARCRARDRRACRAGRAPGCSRRAGTSRTRCSSALRRPGPIRRRSSSKPKRDVCRAPSSKLRRRVTLPLLFPCPCLQLRFDCLQPIDHAGLRPGVAMRRSPASASHRYHLARCHGTSAMDTPYVCAPRRVERAWIDYNGHMNMAYYNLVFDQALDQVFDELGIGAAYVRERRRIVLHRRDPRDVCAGTETRRSVARDVPVTRLGREATAFLRRDVSRRGRLSRGDVGAAVAARRHGIAQSRTVAARMRSTGIDAMMQQHRGLATPDQVGHVMQIPAERSKR